MNNNHQNNNHSNNNHKIINILKDFLKEHKTEVYLYFVFLMSFPISDVLLPKYYGKVMEDLDNKEEINKNVSIIICLLIVNLILETLTNQLDSIFKPKLKSYIRTKIIKNILEKFKESYKEQEVGNLIAKIIKLPSVISDIMHQLKDFIFPMILIFTFAIFYFLTININLGILFIIGTCLFLGFIYIFIQKCINYAMIMDNLSDNVHEDIGDILENLSNIYSSSSCIEEIERIEKYQKELDKAYETTIKCSSNFNTMFSLLYLSAFGGFLYYSFQLYEKKIIKSSDLLSIIIVSLYIISNLKSATSEVRDFIFNIGVVNKTQTFLDELFQIYNKTKSNENKFINIREGNIEFKNVYLKYSDNYLLEDVNLNINSGEVVALVGKIGSGKSSFIKMLLKFHKNDKGQILIDDQDISDVNPDNLRKQIVYIPQHPKLFNRSLYENINYGSNLSKNEIQNLINSIEIPDLFGSLTLDSNVGKGGENLSGGQKQIVLLLRGFLKNSNIIILDEPTSALDNNSKVYVIKTLLKLMQNKTVLIITHDDYLLNSLKFDKIFKFENNKVIQN